MTIEMLCDELNRLMETYPNVANYPVLMVGHDANGKRLYNISVEDIGLDSSGDVLRLWDR